MAHPKEPILAPMTVSATLPDGTTVTRDLAEISGTQGAAEAYIQGKADALADMIGAGVRSAGGLTALAISEPGFLRRIQAELGLFIAEVRARGLSFQPGGRLLETWRMLSD